MKTKLKPEEERTVTPGPKAVEDLISLPSSVDGFVELDEVKVKLRGGPYRERYKPLLVSKECAKVGGIDPKTTGWHTHRISTLWDHHRFAKARGEFIPSLPLFLTILDRYASSPSNGHHEIILETLRSGVLTHTRIDWLEGEIVHYPFEVAGKSKDPVQYTRHNSFWPVTHGTYNVKDELPYSILDVLGVHRFPLSKLFRTDNVVVHFPIDAYVGRTSVLIKRDYETTMIDLDCLEDYRARAFTAKR